MKYVWVITPLHRSGRRGISLADFNYICDEGEYADFELTLRPTYDFIMELLRVGSMIEVLSPDSLRKQMVAWIEDMSNVYKQTE